MLWFMFEAAVAGRLGVLVGLCYSWVVMQGTVLGAPVQNSAIFVRPLGAGDRPWWVAEVPWC